METNLLLSRFWTRIWALLIDSIILGIFGFILTALFKNFFISLGSEGKLIGWFIALAYFSLLNSTLNKGQTIGKKMMNIQVVDCTGQFISLKTSFIRALIFTAPFFLNGYKIPGLTPFSVLTIIQSILIMTLGIGIIVFYIANKETRQSVHDLVAGTYVVQNYRNSMAKLMLPINKRSFYITGGLIVIIICTSVYNFTTNSTAKKLIPLYENIMKQEEIANASITVNTLPLNNNTQVYTIVIQFKNNIANMKDPEYIIHNKEVKQAVKKFIDSQVYEKDTDILNITLTSGYDIGISKSNYWIDTYKPLFKWRELYQF
ncbi:MAG: RDD family protein [Chryseobacterium sp.]|uniref:RDD family protein n=1 Tax=Chryseobacterium sp. TaxID=1871047 RepID=UPI0025C48D5E|nr:RDD family protein [Chryseobacterium sp.]MCJ7932893.1 RDD family protein [Chryseobacterium sp.]